MTLLTLLAVPSAMAWPADDEWRWLERSGAPLEDPLSDVDPASDLYGLELAPAGAWFVDRDQLYVRLRIEGDPQLAPGLVDGGWGVLIDADGDDSFELAVLAAEGGVLRGFPNEGGLPGVSPPAITFGPAVELGSLAGDQIRVLDGDLHSFFVDLGISRDGLEAVGIEVDAPLSLRLVTGPSVFLPWRDQTAEADPVTLDSDRDGLPDPEEEVLGTDPLDADTDDDGVLDGLEALVDSDGDGALDPFDCDSDGDGLFDGLESGVTEADRSADTLLDSGCFVSDADPSTVTDPTLADTDGGGLSDSAEDWNGDGAVGPFETDGTDGADDEDLDGDGIADASEVLAGGEIGVDDTDGDGLSDLEEGASDPDDDGLPAFIDLDSDGDGLSDLDEGLGDADGDGRIDTLETDSDGDGIPDGVEGLGDSDGDGAEDRHDLDSDDDGLSDAFEGSLDFDGDGVPDYLDLDSDDDGLPDEEEGTGDADGDGIPNVHESDSDNDGLPDALEGSDDADNDGRPNFEDTNSDAQGPGDATEGTGDGDCDGIPNFLDPDEEDSFCGPPPPIPGVDPRPDGAPDGPGAALGSGEVTGGCSSAPVGWSLGPMLLAGLLMRRRVWLGLVVSGSAVAQDIDAQRFRPSVDGGSFVQLEDLTPHPTGTVHGSLWGNHADDPLVFRGDSGVPLDLLGSVTTADLTVAGTVGPARLGIDVPVHLFATGFAVEGGARLGDLRVSGKLAPFDHAWSEVVGLRLGAVLDVSLPTGDTDAWLGAGRTWSRGVIAGEVRWYGLRVVANVGARTGTGSLVGKLSIGPGVVAGLGGAWVFDPRLLVALELDGEALLGNAGGGAVPVEWLASAQGGEGSWRGTAGFGTALSRGVGAPDFRVVGGVSYSGRPRRF